ncbi:MAG: methyltransferase, partial [Proteobacteria bacterium]|nr:methyltransferase [Pseudomonadota bacterium]
MVMTRLGVPDLLVSRPLDAETLAERTGTNADAMYRLMRALASEGLYTVDGETVFEYFSD